MGKFNLKRNQVLSLLTAFFIFAIILPGCKKQIDQTTETNINPSSVVTIDQIKQWGSSFLPTIADQPSLAYELAQKKIVNGRSYVRVPTYGAGSEGGFFYFTKKADGSLQSLYVLTDQKDKTTQDGIVGFADFENKTYTLATYQNNKPVALYSVKDNKALFDGVFINNATGSIRKQVDDACAEETSIIKLSDGRDSVIYRKVNGGIPCPGSKTIWQKIWGFFSSIWQGDSGDGGILGAFNWLFGWIGGGSDGGGGNSGAYTGGGSFGSGGYGGWDFSGYASGYSGGGSYGGGDPSGGGWGPYDPGTQDIDPPPPFTWTFSGDDGTTFSDPDPTLEPDLQFDPVDNIETTYPNLTKLIKNLKSFVKDNPEVMSALQKYSGMSKQKILAILTYGKGLTVKVTDVEMDGKYANYNSNKYGVNILRIRASYVRGLEQAVLPSTKKATAFLLAASMLHELVHYGTGQNKINEGIWDFGYGFERDAFTMIVEDNNAGNLVLKFKKF